MSAFVDRNGGGCKHVHGDVLVNTGLVKHF